MEDLDCLLIYGSAEVSFVQPGYNPRCDVSRGRRGPALGSQLWWYHTSTSEFVNAELEEPLVPQKLDLLEQPEQCE